MTTPITKIITTTVSILLFWALMVIITINAKAGDWRRDAFGSGNYITSGYASDLPNRRQAYRRSTITHIPVTRYRRVRIVPEHVEAVHRRNYRERSYRHEHHHERSAFRIPAPGWGIYHAEWVGEGKSRNLCLREQIPVITSEYKRGDSAASDAGRDNWRGTVRTILGEPWTNWNEAIDKMEQCWHSGTGERLIDSHIRCRIAARPCWSVDRQTVDRKPAERAGRN